MAATDVQQGELRRSTQEGKEVHRFLVHRRRRGSQGPAPGVRVLEVGVGPVHCPTVADLPARSPASSEIGVVERCHLREPRDPDRNRSLDSPGSG